MIFEDNIKWLEDCSNCAKLAVNKKGLALGLPRNSCMKTTIIFALGSYHLIHPVMFICIRKQTAVHDAMPANQFFWWRCLLQIHRKCFILSYMRFILTYIYTSPIFISSYFTILWSEWHGTNPMLLKHFTMKISGKDTYDAK